MQGPKLPADRHLLEPRSRQGQPNHTWPFAFGHQPLTTCGGWDPGTQSKQSVTIRNGNGGNKSQAKAISENTVPVSLGREEACGVASA